MISANAAQEIIVAICVIAAALYASRRLMPKLVLRLRMLAAQVLDRAGRPLLAARLRRVPVTAAGCGNGCGSCGSCDSPKPAVTTEQPIRFHRAP